jgi:flagellar biosynthesis protein
MTQSKTELGKTTAVALRYTKDEAPRVCAKGKGEVAQRILQLAKQHDIPLHEDPQLAAALASIDLGAEIPPTLYLVVAKVLAFVYLVNDKSAPSSHSESESKACAVRTE